MFCPDFFRPCYYGRNEATYRKGGNHVQRTLLVTEEINIHAPAEKVWDVLVNPHYIKQWDDLPEDFDEEILTGASVIEWTGYSTLTVTDFEPLKRLRLSLYSPKWELSPAAYDIAYTYILSPHENHTRLTITIGDFAQLADGENYYGESVRFGKAAAEKIKELAEQ